MAGETRAVSAASKMRDPLFVSAATNDVLTWKLPDRDQIERLAEMKATVSGTTKWRSVGPRPTMAGTHEEEGQGTVAVRVELW